MGSTSTTSRWSLRLSRFVSSDSRPATQVSSPSASSQPYGTEQNSRTQHTQHSQQRHSTQPESNAHNTSGGTRAAGTSSRSSPVARREKPREFSNYSTHAVPDSLWFASDFLLGAGMVIVQPATGKVVLLREWEQDRHGRMYDYWFLPKGRKDVGESLEATALREAYEESGYRVSFLPIIIGHSAPSPPGSLGALDRHRRIPCTEPIYISTQEYGQHARRGGEYLTFWYVGQIPEDAVVESGTRMADEVNYETFLFPIDEALTRLNGTQRVIVSVAHAYWTKTVEIQADPDYARYLDRLKAEKAQLDAEGQNQRDDPVSAGRADSDDGDDNDGSF